MPPIIAVDLGGTNIRVAYFPSSAPPPLTQSKVPTRASEGPDAVIGRLIHAIEAQIQSDDRDFRIGVGAPGPLDPIQGIILEAPNLSGWENIPLKSILSEHFKVPVVVGNDANVAALGEWRFGAGRGTQHMIYLTLSTGIGGGIINDGKLLLGAHGLAGELGHMTIEPDGPMCGCGKQGHLEALASGLSIARKAEELLTQGNESTLAEQFSNAGKLTAFDVGQAAIAGDTLAHAIISQAGEIIGRQLASLAHAFNPEVFVLGGGVSQIGDILFNPIRSALHEHVLHTRYVEHLRVLPAALGDDAGLVGAMVLSSQE
jgi:glucokinase